MRLADKELTEMLLHILCSRIDEQKARHYIMLFKQWLHLNKMEFKDFLSKPYKTRENMLREFCMKNNVDFGIFAFNMELMKKSLDEHLEHTNKHLSKKDVGSKEQLHKGQKINEAPQKNK